MWAPLTPTLPRKSSLKKILLSSPSQEILRFLALPNPSAAEDPRSRIRILTPKSKHRSLSKSSLHQPLSPVQPEKPKSCVLNRECFMRKRTGKAEWKRTEVKFRSQKLQIRRDDGRTGSSLCSSMLNQSKEEHPRMDFTFGAQNFWSCVKA